MSLLFGGTELIQFLAALAILHQDDLNKGMNMNLSHSSYRPGAIHYSFQIVLMQFILVFISSWCKIASAAGNGINSVPQTAATTFAFSSVFILLQCSYPTLIQLAAIKRNVNLQRSRIFVFLSCENVSKLQ